MDQFRPVSTKIERVWPNLTELRPNLAFFRPFSTKFARIWRFVDQIRPKIDQFRPKLTNDRPDFDKIRDHQRQGSLKAKGGILPIAAAG